MHSSLAESDTGYITENGVTSSWVIKTGAATVFAAAGMTAVYSVRAAFDFESIDSA